MVASRLSVVAAILAALSLSGCGKETPQTPDRPRVLVQVVQPAPFANAVAITGDVQARVQTDLSFRVGGKIIARGADVGARVAPNQVLARLDPKDLQTQVDSAQAEVVAQQARVTQTQAAFNRQAILLPKGYTSQSEYDSAQASLRSSQSALAAARAELANAREQLGYTALTAETAGVITARHAEVGQVVQATVPIFSLAQDGERDAVFNVFEGLQVTPGEAALTISLLDDPKVRTTGHVREVTPAVSAQTGTLRVKVALDKLPPGMQLGSVVSVALSGQARPSVELPWDALTKAGSKPAVWVLDQAGEAQLQPVTIARFLTGTVLVGDGLEAGQQVVVSGGQLLHPGMKVDIAEGGVQP